MIDFLAQHGPTFLDGVRVTLIYSFTSALIGLLLAAPLAAARLSDRWWLHAPATAYVFFFRGTPFLAQLFLIYYGSGQFRPELQALGLWTLFREPWFCALLALSLNTAAYTSEVMRGAVAAIPKGEIEAAMSLGLSRLQCLTLVIIPRAMRFGWPGYTNEVVYQVQATSLVSIITIMDITGVARVIATRDFLYYESFLTAAALYLAIVFATIHVARRIERRLMRHEQRT